MPGVSRSGVLKTYQQFWYPGTRDRDTDELISPKDKLHLIEGSDYVGRYIFEQFLLPNKKLHSLINSDAPTTAASVHLSRSLETTEMLIVQMHAHCPGAWRDGNWTITYKLATLPSSSSANSPANLIKSDDNFLHQVQRAVGFSLINYDCLDMDYVLADLTKRVEQKRGNGDFDYLLSGGEAQPTMSEVTAFWSKWQTARLRAFYCKHYQSSGSRDSGHESSSSAMIPFNSQPTQGGSSQVDTFAKDIYRDFTLQVTEVDNKVRVEIRPE